MNNRNSKKNEIIEGKVLSMDRKLQAKDFLSFIIMIVVFYTIAIALWLAFDSIFYLVNFIIIGTSLALGLGLWPVLSKKKKHRARKLSQALIGGYMFFGLGFGLIYIFFGYIQPENMQFEAFWFYLFSGIYTAAVLHYLIAKIIGPFLFNRGWCGWACWTAAILDYLPWEKSPGRIKKIGILRYIHFIIGSLLLIILFFVFNYTLNSITGAVSLTGTAVSENINIYNNIFIIPEFWWFIISMSTEKIIISDKTNFPPLETPNKGEKINKRVDINILLTRVREEKKKENKLNLVYFSMFASVIFVVGIFLSF